MKLPELEYGLLSEMWSEIELNPTDYNSTVVINDDNIYATFEGNMLIEFSRFGQRTDISLCSGDIHLAQNQVYFVHNNCICTKKNLFDIKCEKQFVVAKNNIITVSSFLDEKIISKYENGIKKNQSKLFDCIKKIKLYKNELVLQCENEIFFLDQELEESKTLSFPLLQDFETNDDEICIAADELYFYKNNQLEGKQKINEASKQIIITSNFILYSTEGGLYCISKKNETVWSKTPVDYMGCFTDNTEHIILAKDKTISIYEIETNILVWQEQIEYPVCSNLAISNSGFAVCSNSGGGIHYFGGRPQWDGLLG